MRDPWVVVYTADHPENLRDVWGVYSVYRSQLRAYKAYSRFNKRYNKHGLYFRVLRTSQFSVKSAILRAMPLDV